MATVVVPFRGSDPKRRLEPMPADARIRLAEAMLADVLDAARAVGQVLVVAADPPALPAAGTPATYLVVNADLPCVTARDLLALAGAIPDAGIAVAAGEDGTTNALGLAAEHLFEPLYGPGSAERFAALAASRMVDAPNLVDDVDTPADLARLGPRLGPSTRVVLAALRIGEAA